MSNNNRTEPVIRKVIDGVKVQLVPDRRFMEDRREDESGLQRNDRRKGDRREIPDRRKEVDDSENRRASVRMKISGIRLFVANPNTISGIFSMLLSSGKANAALTDISQLGIGLVAELQAKRGEILKIKITMPSKAVYTLNAKVMAAVPSTKDGKKLYRYGLEFCDPKNAKSSSRDLRDLQADLRRYSKKLLG